MDGKPVEPEGANSLDSVRLANEKQNDPEIDNKIDVVVGDLSSRGVKLNPITTEYFYDPNLFLALSSRVDNLEQLPEYVEHTGRFFDIIALERQKRFKGDSTGFLGEKVNLPESKHSGGRTRRAEEGYKLNVDYLRAIGIDPSRVLFFRKTQPMGDQPKPEYYWTSDYREALTGLNVEIPTSQRNTAVILVADLQTVNDNGGLIQDINDDSGMAVRQIGENPFDQDRALAQFPIVS